MSSESESTPVDNILAEAAERTADRKRERDRITTPDDFTQFSEFDGIVDLDLNVRIPKSYYEAVKVYCQLDNTRVSEWFNYEILNLIESIDVGAATPNFIQRFHLRGLSRDKKDAMVQAYRKLSLSEETLSDA